MYGARGGTSIGKSFFNADDDSDDDDDDFSDEDDDGDIGGALGRGGTSYLSKPQAQGSGSFTKRNTAQQQRPISPPVSPRPPSPEVFPSQLHTPPTPLAGVEPNQYVGYRGISDKQKTAPRSASAYDPTQDPAYFKQQQQQQQQVSTPPLSRDEPPQPRPRRGSRDETEDDDFYPVTTTAPAATIPPAATVMMNHNNNDMDHQTPREQFPTSIPRGDHETGTIPLPDVYSASASESKQYYANDGRPATIDPSQKPSNTTVATEADRKTIKWLIIGLAIALVCVAALVGGITGWQLNRKNKDDSNSNISSGSGGATSAPAAAPSALVNAPTIAPVTNTDDDEDVTAAAPTLAPSLAVTPEPTGPAFNQALFDSIAATSPLGDEGLLEDGTVQNLAFLATANETSFADERLLQRYAMRVFYYSTNGPTTWIAADGWDGSLDECLWYTTAEDPTTICSSDVVQTLELSANGVTGTLPAELSMLTALSRLYIKGATDTPGLTGGIPESLGGLASMSVVVLNDHQFDGPLPDAVVSGWSSATVINIVGSGLTGTIPASVSNLALCSNFLLDSNALTGPIPSEIGSMSALVAFGVANNQLTGTLPALSIATVKTFSVATNQLTGALPSFAGFPALVKLSLEGNSFSGAVDTCGSSATTLSCAAATCTCATCSCV